MCLYCFLPVSLCLISFSCVSHPLIILCAFKPSVFLCSLSRHPHWLCVLMFVAGSLIMPSCELFISKSPSFYIVYLLFVCFGVFSVSFWLLNHRNKAASEFCVWALPSPATQPSETWRGLIERNSLTDLNLSGVCYRTSVQVCPY